MKKNTIFYVLLGLMVVNYTAVFCEDAADQGIDAAVASEAEEAADQAAADVAADFIDVPVVATEDTPLLCTGANAGLSVAFDQDPNAVGRIITADENVKKILGGLERFAMMPKQRQKMFEARVVDNLRKLILTPVYPFLSLLRSFESICTPILEESLGRVGCDYEKSNLKAFMDSPPELAPTFFEDNLKTKDELLVACEELSIIFRGIEATHKDRFVAERAKMKADKEAKNPGSTEK